MNMGSGMRADLRSCPRLLNPILGPRQPDTQACKANAIKEAMRVLGHSMCISFIGKLPDSRLAVPYMHCDLKPKSHRAHRERQGLGCHAANKPNALKISRRAQFEGFVIFRNCLHPSRTK